MLNVITGTFVETALAFKKQDNTLDLIERLKVLFDEADLDCNGRMSHIEFYLASETLEIEALFQQLELPIKQVDNIFEAKNKTASGDCSLSVEEFVKSAQLISSPARMYDLLGMHAENARALTHIKDSQAKVESALSRINQMLTIAVSGTEPRDCRVSGAEPRSPTNSKRCISGRPLAVRKVLLVVCYDDDEEV